MRSYRCDQKRMVGTALLSVVMASMPLAAQQASPAQAGGNDMSALRAEVQQLKAQQQLILDRLDDLKKLLRAGPNTPPAIKLPDTLSLQGDTYRGASTATVAIIEYGDFECPFCRRFQQSTFPQILDQYVKTGKVRYIYRDMPLPFHAHAMPAAQAVHCAAEQGKYWQMYDSLFADQIAQSTAELDQRAAKAGVDTGKLDSCMTSARSVPAIQRGAAEAAKMEIDGTPTFLIGTVTPDGQVVKVKASVVGAQPFEAFQAAVEPLLGTPAKATVERPGGAMAGR